jgi:hypothetical protein
MDPETYATLVEALTADLRDAWAATTRLVGEQQVYGFGPYTHLDASYFVGTCSSEQGLLASARACVAGDERELAATVARLRWSPCDSPLHCTIGDFVRSCAVLDVLEDVDEQVAEQVFEAALIALETLDGAGVFGSGAQREALTLGLWMGDQSDEQRLAYVRRLNPPEVARRFEFEQEAARAAWQTLMSRG